MVEYVFTLRVRLPDFCRAESAQGDLLDFLREGGWNASLDYQGRRSAGVIRAVNHDDDD